MGSGMISPKERILNVLGRKKADRPPVICPGGMMNAAVVDIMTKTGHILPDAHLDTGLMTELAYDVYENTGFENFGIPFCMTIEAEVLGSEINYGTLQCEPKIQKERFSSVSEVDFKPLGIMEKNKRVAAVIQSIHHLTKKQPDVPVIGSLTGPLSTAASIVDPMTFLKELRKNKENSHKAVNYVTNHLLEYARLMAENGVTIISIADPTATGEILGPKMFEEYAVHYLNILADNIHKMGIPVIIHICGKMDAVEQHAAALHSDALSVDAFVSLKKIKQSYPHITTMGNLSTIALEQAKPKIISAQTEHLLADKINIIAPACGLSTSTPLENIQTFTEVVRQS